MNEQYAQMTKPLPEVYPLGDSRNGFGFEITFRIKCNSDVEPPMWPCRIMQDMAKYVFDYKNIFGAGDHLAWHSPLDSISDDDSGTSRIENLLMTLDPQLTEKNATLGPVKFIQMVGACNEELQAARSWNVGEVLKFMQQRVETGGPLLVTDMRRGETIFELDPEKRDLLERGIKQAGSDMWQIGAKHKTSPVKPDWFVQVERQMKNREQMGVQLLDHDEDDHETQAMMQSESVIPMPMEDDYPVRTPSRMSMTSQSESVSRLLIENADNLPDKHYDGVYILLSHESAQVLPVMLDGRLAHGRPFFFQSIKGDSVVTFVPEGCPTEALVNAEQPFVKRAHWLQIYVPHKLREQMNETIKSGLDVVPRNYSWPEFNLHITVVEEI